MNEQQRNSFHESDKDSHIQPQSPTVNEQDHDHQTSEELKQVGQSDRYYYAYGPYQSIGHDETSPVTNSTDSPDHTNNVWVIPSIPTKPLPFSSATQQDSLQGGFTGSGGRREQAAPSTPPQRDWNFKMSKQSGNTSFKGMFISFMAGMLVVSTSMMVADKTNLFTGNEGAGDSSSSNIASASVSRTSLPGGMNVIADVAQRASPAVVKIETFSKSSDQRRSRHPFDYFFDSDSGIQGEGDIQPRGMGTGFIIEDDGHILTNEHVIQNAEQIKVTVPGHKEPFEAELLGYSKDSDLAMLKIKSSKPLPTLRLGDSDKTRVGEVVIALGTPSGFEGSVTQGVISAKNRTLPVVVDNSGEMRNYDNLLQTDASINPGNSGGALVNMENECVGMNVAVSRSAQGIGFAIAANSIKGKLELLKKKGEIPKDPVSFIGVELTTMTDYISSKMGIKPIRGVLVSSVYYNTPAHQAGLQAYDIITSIDGTKCTTLEEFKAKIKQKKVGNTVKLQVFRHNQNIDIEVTIGDKVEYSKRMESRR